MICALFGNRDCPYLKEEALEDLICNLIQKRGVTCFYVGNHGEFDRKSAQVLKKVSKQFDWVRYYVVLAYHPADSVFTKEQPTILADGVETVPPKFRIIYRNKWMIQQAQVVVCYLHDITGNTRNLAEYAQRKGKEIVFID